MSRFQSEYDPGFDQPLPCNTSSDITMGMFSRDPAALSFIGSCHILRFSGEIVVKMR